MKTVLSRAGSINGRYTDERRNISFMLWLWLQKESIGMFARIACKAPWVRMCFMIR